MAVLTQSWILDLVLLLFALITPVILFYKRRFQYWNERNVPYVRPSIPMGNIGEVNVRKSMGEVFREIYESHPEERFVGMWTMATPMLLLRDPELIKQVLVKDFMSFHDRGMYVNEKHDPLSGHLFALSGERWRDIRVKLTPTFTSGKMKMMLPTVVECSEQLRSFLLEPARSDSAVEVKEISARFTTDVISLCAFGIQTNSLNNPDAIFRKMGKRLLEPTAMNAFRDFATLLLPKLATLLRLRTMDPVVGDFFLDAVRETYDTRRQQHIKRNDFFQLLIQLMQTGKLEEDSSNASNTKLTFEEAAAQAFVFFVAGYETSSSTIQYVLYELALNPDIQDRAREEMRRVLAKHDGKMNYEAIHEMPYLGRVIDETLRKYPVVPLLFRETTRDYQIPGSKVNIEKGTGIQVPVYGLHHDPKHYPDPERFDPERFTEEAKAQRHHYAYLPFGEGPRNCIGMRFGLMQTRVGLITMISNFRFDVCKQTPIPMVYDPKSVVISPKEELLLKISLL